MSSNNENLKVNELMLPDLAFSQIDTGWVAEFRYEKRIVCGLDFFVKFQTINEPSADGIVPAVKKQYAKLLKIIQNNIESILGIVESEAMKTDVVIDDKCRAYIWINDDYFDYETWSFVIEPKSQSYTFCCEFFGKEYREAWCEH